MTAKEIRELTPEEIEQKVSDIREEIFNLRLQGATGHLENPSRFRVLRRDLARFATIKRETELGLIANE